MIHWQSSSEENHLTPRRKKNTFLDVLVTYMIQTVFQLFHFSHRQNFIYRREGPRTLCDNCKGFYPLSLAAFRMDGWQLSHIRSFTVKWRPKYFTNWYNKTSTLFPPESGISNALEMRSNFWGNSCLLPAFLEQNARRIQKLSDQN